MVWAVKMYWKNWEHPIMKRWHHLKPIRSIRNKSPAEEIMILILMSQSFRNAETSLVSTHQHFIAMRDYKPCTACLYNKQLQLLRLQGDVNVRMFLLFPPHHRPPRNWTEFQDTALHTLHTKKLRNDESVLQPAERFPGRFLVKYLQCIYQSLPREKHFVRRACLQRCIKEM